MEEIYLGGQLRSFFKLPDGFPPGQPKEEIKMAKDEFYRNFSNRASFNGQNISADEELVPVVLSKEMAQTLKPAGLNYDNVETWTFRHGKKVPVVFIPNKKGKMESYMKVFNDDVERYLKHKDDILSDDLSLDEFLEDIDDEDDNGFDPTGTTQNEDTAMLLMTINMLIEELSSQDENMGKILRLLIAGYQKNEILGKVELGKGKSQGYAFIEKTQKLAKDLYEKKYR